MTDQSQPKTRLLTRASESRCRNCPPDRVCAWDCVQGAGQEDIVIGAVLEQSGGWAWQPVEPGEEPARRALWESFNT